MSKTILVTGIGGLTRDLLQQLLKKTIPIIK